MARHYAEFETDVTVTMTKRDKFMTNEWHIDYADDVKAEDDAYEHSSISIKDCLEELKAYIKKEQESDSINAVRRSYLMNLLDTISGWDIETENSEPELKDWA
jgi:hypothetical protein